MDQELLKRVRALPVDYRGTVASIATFLGRSRPTVYRYVQKDLLVSDITWGNRRFFSREALERFVKLHTSPNQAVSS